MLEELVQLELKELEALEDQQDLVDQVDQVVPLLLVTRMLRFGLTKDKSSGNNS